MSIHEAIRSAAIVGLACLGVLAMPALATDTAFATQADRILDRYTDPTGAGASVAVVRDHRVIYESARGRASIELHVAANVENVYRIGSITKTVTAASVLLLAHQGKLSTSDSLAAFLPDYPGASDITIDQLLSHTAGVSDEWSADGSQRMDTKAMVEAIRKQPLDFRRARRGAIATRATCCWVPSSKR